LLFRRRLLWGIWVAVTLLMMLLTVVHVRYFLQVLPVLLYACWLAVVWVHRRAGGTAGAPPAPQRRNRARPRVARSAPGVPVGGARSPWHWRRRWSG
jgi:hypothetical protein